MLSKQGVSLLRYFPAECDQANKVVLVFVLVLGSKALSYLLNTAQAKALENVQWRHGTRVLNPTNFSETSDGTSLLFIFIRAVNIIASSFLLLVSKFPRNRVVSFISRCSLQSKIDCLLCFFPTVVMEINYT